MTSVLSVFTFSPRMANPLSVTSASSLDAPPTVGYVSGMAD